VSQPADSHAGVRSRFHVDDAALTATWQGYLWALADELRRQADADSSLLNTLLAPSAEARWLSPPLNDLALVEEFLSTLRYHRFTDEQAAAAYPTFFWCVLGLLRVSTVSTPAVSGPTTYELVAAPTVQRLRAELSQEHSRSEYEDAVEALLERMQISLVQ